jgi:hypothetical protein
MQHCLISDDKAATLQRIVVMMCVSFAFGMGWTLGERGIELLF